MSPVLAAISVPATLDLALNSEKVILVLMASIVLAAGSWFYFEKPILGLKKYFQYRQSVSSERLSYASRSRGGALTR
jgi:peptidoglycan/LPS O-acetylase OafA/YrhL